MALNWIIRFIRVPLLSAIITNCIILGFAGKELVTKEPNPGRLN